MYVYLLLLYPKTGYAFRDTASINRATCYNGPILILQLPQLQCLTYLLSSLRPWSILFVREY